MLIRQNCEVAMNFQDLKYADANKTCIIGVIDGKSMAVPVDPSNTDYQEIMRLVDAGELTIAEPD